MGSKIDIASLANVKWSPAVNSRFEVVRLERIKALKQQGLPDDHDPWQPHRLNFHALILFTQGTGTHNVDFVNRPVEAGTLIHICANQIHCFRHSPKLEALMLVFIPAALPTNLLGLSASISEAISWSTIQYIWPSVTSIKLEQARILQKHIELLEAHQKIDSSEQPAAQYLLWSTISLASQMAIESKNHDWDKAIDPKFLEFVELLEQSFESCRSVKWYSEKMNCSAKTLYRICMTTVGKSAKAIADERVMIEAQRRLLSEQATVKEVGYSLGFEETTNFVKFFRRFVGQNPNQFRNLHRINSRKI